MKEGKAPPHLQRRARSEVAAVYRRADAAYGPFCCPASGECCQLAKTGRPPWLFEAEWRYLQHALAEAGRSLPPAREDGGCPFLDEQGRRCTVYAARPLGCRTFFCGRRTGRGREPTEEMSHLTRRLEAATALIAAGTEPHPLQSWVEEARR